MRNFSGPEVIQVSTPVSAASMGIASILTQNATATQLYPYLKLTEVSFLFMPFISTLSIISLLQWHGSIANEMQVSSLTRKSFQSLAWILVVLHSKLRPVSTPWAVTNVQERWPSNRMPTSCEDLWRIGHSLSGLYLVLEGEIVKNVYCNFTKLPSDAGTNT